MKNLTFFKSIGASYIYFSTKNKIRSILSIILILLGCIFNIFYDNTLFEKYEIIPRIMSIFVPVLWLYQVSSKIEIDTENKNIIKHYFMGIYKRYFSINSFKNFHSVRNTTNFIYDGTDLYMMFNTDKKSTDVKISKMRNTIKLNELKLEITYIINSC